MSKFFQSSFFYFYFSISNSFLFSVERDVAVVVPVAVPVVVAAMGDGHLERIPGASPALSEATTVPFPHLSPGMLQSPANSEADAAAAAEPLRFRPYWPEEPMLEERVQQDRWQIERLQAERARVERFREERMEAERVREERLREDRMQAEREREERLREGRMRVEVMREEQARAEQQREEELEYIPIDRNMPVILLDRDPDRITVHMTRHDFDGYLRYSRVETQRWRQWVYFNTYCDRLQLGRHEPHLLEIALGGRVTIHPYDANDNNNNNN